MKRIFIFFLLICIISPLKGQNLNLVGQLTYSSGTLSNLWGYTAPNGTEYALVGTSEGLSIVSLANPANPVQVQFVSGPSSNWREVKAYGNYAYVTNENSEGLMIVNLSNLPGPVTSTTYTGGNYFNGITNTTISFSKIHTVFVDEDGFCYLNGANFTTNTNNRGVIILDLNSSPTNPTIVGLYDSAYVHDCFARNNRLYTAEIYAGRFRVIDITNKTNPIVLASQTTAGNFTHNIWPDDVENYVYVTDEESGTTIGAYHISDLSDIQLVDSYAHPPGTAAPHNTHFLNNYIFNAYYQDGVTVVDVTRPELMVEMGHYDTSPSFSGAGYEGCWGIYPYFPSGTIIASDQQAGLYVFSYNNARASFLEGTVTNVVTGNPIANATINIPGLGSVTTDVLGNYAAGYASAGNYNATISATGYTNSVQAITLVAGQTTPLSVTLCPTTGQTVPSFSFNTSYCSGANIAALPTISDNGITGTWSPAINNTATTTYTFTPSIGQCATTTTKTITINANVTPSFASVGPYCSVDAIPALPTSSTNSPAITGTWSPAINNTITTTYTFTPSLGQCATTATKIITINAPVAPSFAAVGPYCSGDAIPALPTSSTNSPAITGTWSPAINNTATTTYTFTPSIGQCATTAAITVSIETRIVPNPNFSDTVFCNDEAGFAMPALIDGIAGQWMGAGVSNNFFNPSQALPGDNNLLFMADSGQCADDISEVFTVENCLSPGVVVKSRFLLQGYYLESSGCMMNTALNDKNLIPLGQPYGGAPHYYAGTEIVSTIPTGVVDWVLIQLRDAADRSVVVAERCGFLTCEGYLLDIDGSEGLSFPTVNPDAYYITVLHRNHLGIMTAAPVSLPSATAYDFTSSPSQALGTGQLYPVGGTYYAMIGGDYDSNGNINSLDYNLWYSSNTAVNEYLSWDGNGSAVINNLDYNLWFANRSKLAVVELQF